MSPPAETNREVALLTALSEVPPPAPVYIDGRTWGPWRFRARNLTLEHTKTGYWIDLEACTTSAKALAYLCQVSRKTGLGAECAGFLLQALEALLNPQSTLCPNEQGKEFHAGIFLRSKLRMGRRRVEPDKKKAPSAMDEAAAFLLDALADGPVPANVLFREAGQTGIAVRTLHRAKGQIGVKTRKTGQPGQRNQQWVWTLPSAESSLPTNGKPPSPFTKEN